MRDTMTKAERALQKARDASDAAMRAALRGKGNAEALARRVASALAAERVAWEQVKGNG